MSFDRQAAFEKMVRGLHQQGRKSGIRENGRLTCQYRGDGGTKCAVGFLIPDDEYNSDIEGETCNPGTMAGRLLRELYGCTGDDLLFLATVQGRLHDYTEDNVLFIQEMLRQATWIASRHGLSSAFLAELRPNE